tara:strand:- start:222 stop:647 length:426 start_codon:yes stop_codon:yes gene_type:complete
MSWATCYSGSNNIHHKSPPLMSDTRQFTNYDAACNNNNNIKKRYEITSNYAYRQFLINSGNAVMNANSNLAKMCSTKSCNGSDNMHHNKYLFSNCQDNSVPFGYQSSDLKNMYLSREALQDSLSGPMLTQEQLLIKRSGQL